MKGGAHATPLAAIARVLTKVRQADSLLEAQLELAEIFAANVGEYGELSAQKQLEVLLGASHSVADALWALETYQALLAYEEPE